MNVRMIRYVLGRILLAEGALMVLPLAVALYYGEPARDFLLPILILLVCGWLCGMKKPENAALFARDGFAVVSLAWIALSLFGALPFYFSGFVPSFIDCFFETVSGLTTTGATILENVEALPQGLMFWRCFTHWIGGMGVLVFVMAVLPLSNDGHGMHLLRAEVPGPIVGKLVSRMSDTAKILYSIYLVMTIVLIVLLMLGGMSWFDACVHGFATAGTGGFSNQATSVGSYDNAYFDVVIGTAMLLFGVNFNLFYFVLIGRIRDVWRSEELRAYVGVVGISVVIIAIDLIQMYGSFVTCLRHAFFQVSSIITTTGFATVDFNQWPALSRTILVILMIVGACAGSTGGGMKMARWVILTKASICDMKKMLHPNAVAPVRFEGKTLSDKQVRSVHLYLTVYILLFAISALLLSLADMDLVTNFTAIAACFNNVGPGLGTVGPMDNFGFFPGPAKLLLCFCMLAGRLEIFPLLLLFAPSRWRRRG